MPNVLSKIALVAALALSSSALAEDTTGAPSDGWSVFRPSLNEVEDGRVRDEEAPDIVYDFESGTLDGPIQRPDAPERRAPVATIAAPNNQQDPSAPTMGDGASIRDPSAPDFFNDPSAPDMLPSEGENTEVAEESNPSPWSTVPDVEELAEADIREQVREARRKARNQERRKNSKKRQKEKKIQKRWEKRMAAREARKAQKKAQKKNGDFQENGDNRSKQGSNGGE